ncbi:minichromosome maintenance domain-containing protein 2 isoform X1 [Procambarus clarkii]|uniref:minichromosome maintenance domain-containing protein 2 isoform X1 n=1 Tax=Procambarus clarkii TaxID=6728 RepID=UPI0037430ABC
MKRADHLHISALRWLDRSGGLDRLRSTLVSRASLHPVPKVLSTPVYINVMHLREIDEELASLVMSRPVEAQQVFHHVVHVASVAINLQLDCSSLSYQPEPPLPSEDDHCAPGPETYSPDTPDYLTSLYLDHQDKSQKLPAMLGVAAREVTLDFEDLNSTLQSLASNLPLETSVSGEASRSVLTAAQIHAPLRVDGIPWVKEWMVGGVKDLPLHLEEPTLALVSGRVISIMLPTTYTVWARYVCSSGDCLGTARDLHVRVFAEGRREADTIHHRPVCRVCRSPLVEDPSSRELGEKSHVLVLADSQASALTKNAHQRAQALNLVLKDEMLHGLEPGQEVAATVMIVPRNLPQLPSVEAIMVHPPPPLRSPSSLPPMFRRLAEDRASSPWSLVLTLAYMFAASVTPAGTFHTFKLALLLSLASCSSRKAGLAVLGVGSNTTLLLRLLWYSARYAPHSVIHSSLDALTASSTKDSEGSVWVQGGSLLLAHGGVCVLGDFSKFKKEARQLVCRALESGVVQVGCGSRPQHHTLTYPLRAAAWACYDPVHAHARTTTAEPLDAFLRVPLGDLTKSITDVFGLVVYTETPGGELESEAEEVITLQTLLEGTTPSPHPQPLLPPDQLTQYLCMVRGLQVVFSTKAETLIRGYYVATRRLRGDCVQGSAVPVTAINTLAQVAASHARLALRSTVESWDAAAAVLMCEEALAALSGYSLLHISPTPHLPPHSDLHTLLGRKNDERMMNFQKTLEEFIYTHTGDIPVIN